MRSDLTRQITPSEIEQKARIGPLIAAYQRCRRPRRDRRGFLVVEEAPVLLRHPEHETARIPPGHYHGGRQRELHAGEARRAAD